MEKIIIHKQSFYGLLEGILIFTYIPALLFCLVLIAKFIFPSWQRKLKLASDKFTKQRRLFFIFSITLVCLVSFLTFAFGDCFDEPNYLMMQFWIVCFMYILLLILAQYFLFSKPKRIEFSENDLLQIVENKSYL